MDWSILQGRMVQYRRHFHQYPEVSHEEVKTREFIREELELLGLKPYSFSGKDVAVEIRGKAPGKTVAIRADMDALPVQEETGLPFASKNKGKMHACGHDGHMAILLGLVQYFVENKCQYNGTIRFIFQHAEESIPGGAREVVAAGGIKGVDAIFGYHLWQPLPLGTIGIRKGAVMAGADEFNIRIFGKGGHGSMPNETVDPTLLAAMAIMQIHTIVSRSLSPIDPAVVSIGELKSGSTYNVIPDQAKLSGTVRHFNQQVSKQVHQRLEDILAGICLSYGAKYELEYSYGDPPVVNDEKLYSLMRKKAAALFGGKSIMEMEPQLGSEDFSYYTDRIPGMYTFIGVGKKENPYGHHHPKFDIDENMFVPTVKLVSGAVLDYFKNGEFV
ncbi:amidohydrolase [Robertmurraya sp. DFI.2.37]|uniref:M20 metallopeptidase family protein n=1 Tax=Robertmurraya sp. DFI.2.37 TaxID=3031819 RepID=UPI001247AB58|nr:amidohydrolase [Robertmurraya sp. DFI.2.37]MDF1507980.1 amidohydrolase [Robertmurraya sp. DFI.2.37]